MYGKQVRRQITIEGLGMDLNSLQKYVRVSVVPVYKGEGRCDLCGTPIRVSFGFEDTRTGEILHIGGECRRQILLGLQESERKYADHLEAALDSMGTVSRRMIKFVELYVGVTGNRSLKRVYGELASDHDIQVRRSDMKSSCSLCGREGSESQVQIPTGEFSYKPLPTCRECTEELAGYLLEGSKPNSGWSEVLLWLESA